MLSSAFNHSIVRKKYDVAATLPESFQSLVDRRILSKDTQRLLTRFSYACQYGLTVRPCPEEHFLDFTLASPHLTAAEPTVEKCRILALLYYAHMRWSIALDYVASFLCHTISRTKLSQALPWVPETNDTCSVEYLVWCWMVLVDSHHLEGAVLPQDGFSTLGEFKFHFPNWQDRISIENEVLPKFFWRDEEYIGIRQAWGG